MQPQPAGVLCTLCNCLHHTAFAAKQAAIQVSFLNVTLLRVRPLCKFCLQGGSRLSFNSASQYGGALQADETCSIVVRDALLLNNTSAYGGATAIKNSARLQVQAGAVYKDNCGEYGGCIAAQVCRLKDRLALAVCQTQRLCCR